MAKPKGSPKTGGRQKGTPNRITRTVKEAIEAAFDELGGVDYLVRTAERHPTAFLSLLGRVLPTEVSGGVNVDLIEAIRRGRARAGKV
jgi:hypothetical protein